MDRELFTFTLATRSKRMKPNDELHLILEHLTLEYIIIEVNELYLVCNYKDRAVNHSTTDATFARVHIEDMLRNGTAVIVEK